VIAAKTETALIEYPLWILAVDKSRYFGFGFFYAHFHNRTFLETNTAIGTLTSFLAFRDKCIYIR
jgi:hypothetical protein